MSEQHTLVLIDDHAMFRAGLRAILNDDGQFEVVGEAGEGREGLRLVRRLAPSLALVDISLPDITGIQLTEELLHVQPNLAVLIVSMHAKVDYVTESFRAGALGYVVKDSASEILLQALRTIADGRYFIDTVLTNDVVRKLIARPPSLSRHVDRMYETLTKREQEIMGLLAEGLSPKDISDRLCISNKTVENHRSNIMRKLSVHSTLELVRYAARLGLIDIDSWMK
ncbi:MAG: response regulator transcription factor [Acidobacteria bacterium]|nr:response regulator transcription factor [Acidobacteriota bacterium]